MLRIIIPGKEHFNEDDNTFSTVGDVTIDLEHSLFSVSKWESEHKKPFLSGDEKTAEEIFSYILAMVQTPNIGLDQLVGLTQREFLKIQEYINSSQSATTFGEMPGRNGRSETITSELVYYWMVAFNIPFEVETWHLNRLFSLIRICNMKNSKPRKMSKHELAQRNREVNERRKKELGTRG